MPAARARDRDDDQQRSHAVAPFLLEPTWSLLEGLVHRAWGFAKERGYTREEKLTWGAILSVLQRLGANSALTGATISAMEQDVQRALEEPMLKYFRYEHLSPALQEVSKPFAELAARMVEKAPRNPERTVCLRKLLEAKDAAVRCVLP